MACKSWTLLASAKINLEGLGRAGGSRYFGKVEPIQLGSLRLRNLLQKGDQNI